MSMNKILFIFFIQYFLLNKIHSFEVPEFAIIEAHYKVKSLDKMNTVLVDIEALSKVLPLNPRKTLIVGIILKRILSEKVNQVSHGKVKNTFGKEDPFCFWLYGLLSVYANENPPYVSIKDEKKLNLLKNWQSYLEYAPSTDIQKRINSLMDNITNDILQSFRLMNLAL